ncbi:MAG: hypothetical protein Q4D62_04370 [Planctomycetia bacterium]|nr:hypothetical protein [Planctomycetia bacterium]
MSTIPKLTGLELTVAVGTMLAAAAAQQRAAAQERRREEQERQRAIRVVHLREGMISQTQNLAETMERQVEEWSEKGFAEAERVGTIPVRLASIRERASNEGEESELVRLQRELREICRFWESVTESVVKKEGMLSWLGNAESEIARREKWEEGRAWSLCWEGWKTQIGPLAMEEWEETEAAWRKVCAEFHERMSLWDTREAYRNWHQQVEEWKKLPFFSLRGEDYRNVWAALERLREILKTEDMEAIRPVFHQTEEVFRTSSQAFEEQRGILEEKHREATRQMERLERVWSDLRHRAEECGGEVLLEGGAERYGQLCRWMKKEAFDQVLSQTGRLAMEWEGVEVRLRQWERVEQLFGKLRQEISEEMSRRFDTAGWEKCLREAETVQKQLRNRMRVDFEKTWSALRQLLERHRERVLPEMEKWTETGEAWGVRLSEMADETAACESDAVVMRWAAPDVRQQRERLAEMEQLRLDGNWEQLEMEVAAWKTRMAAILQAVYQTEEQELRREYIFRAFQEKLAEMGYEMTETTLENPENPASALVFSVASHDGKGVSVRLSQKPEEGVMYAVDGFPMRVESAGGKAVRTCDEAVRQLEILKRILREKGIELGKLHWEDQPPVDWEKEAMSLPQEQTQVREQRW